MQDINELEDVLEDFDIPPASYEVWVLGYTRFDILTNFEFMVGSFVDPDAAVDRAKTITVSDIIKESSVPDEVFYFSIEVETVVTDMNAGTIYRRHLENNKPAIDIWINETDYELTEESNLRIACNSIKSCKIGDYLNMKISGRPDTKQILLRAILKDDSSVTCEFID